MQSNTHLTSEDKIWAAIAHASVLFSFWGPIVPAILWFLQRRKSAHARFHAIQALSYQVVSFWIYAVVLPILMIVMACAMVVLIAAEAGRGGNTFGSTAVLLPFLMYGPIFASWGLYLVLGLVGAVASLMGRDFRYPLIGAWLHRKLQYLAGKDASIDENQEDQVVAAVSHATCILPVFGVITPVIMWITQKDRSSFLRIQTLQAAVYQGVATVIYIGVMVVAFVGMFAMMGISIASETHGNPLMANPLGEALMIPILCLDAIFLIGGPLYLIFGGIASVRSLRGRDYNYPVLGRYLRKRMDAPATPSMEAAK